jgi:aminoglycoside phosphotransferase (APT) family kinase protein
VTAVADPKMPCLADALDVAAVQPHIPDRLRLRTARLIRHKPGRRALIEYEGEFEGRPVALVGKLRAKGADRATYGVMQALWQTKFADDNPDGISVPEPIALVPALGMWLQRKVPGTPLTQLLAGPRGASLCRRAAEAAHKLHRVNIPARRSHTMADELTILHERLAELAADRPAWAVRLARMADSCRRLAVDVANSTPRGVHRDYYPDQVLVDGERLYLVDFDLYCTGDPALDAGNFLGHVTEGALRATGDPAAWADREAAFEGRFTGLTGGACRSAVRAYATLTLARHVAISTRFPDRRPFTERLIELCEERLAAPREFHAAVARGVS